MSGRASELDPRYWLLAALLAALAVLHVAKGLWVGDFWNHVAVVRELAANPLTPRHPVLGTETPHPFFSPYLLGVAVIGRAVGVGAVGALAGAALANLALLVVALPWFLRGCCGSRGDTVAFYFLLFALLLWGVAPWSWSAFIHLGVIGYVLPYPATFTLALGFACLGFHVRFLSQGNARWLLALPPLLAVALLSHPLTAVVLFTSMGALLAGRRPATGARAVALSGGVVALAVLLAFAWPYFDTFDLLLAPGGGQLDWHETGRVFYEDVFARTFPALAAVPVLVWRWRRDRRDPLVLAFAALLLVYVVGFASGRFGLGRVVSHVVLCAQLALAAGAAEIEPRLTRSMRAALVAGVVIAAVLTGNLARPVLRVVRPAAPSVGERLAFLARHVGQYDLVLASLEDSLTVPAVAGKVIASPQPLYWIDDHKRRRADARAFFAVATPRDEREAIARKYDARFALLRTRQAARAPALRADLLTMGEVVERSEEYELIALDP